MDVRQPTVRRLCVAASGSARLLATACRSGGFERWFVETDSKRGLELACTLTGCDERAVIGDLITVLRRLIADRHHSPARVTAAFHAGATHLDENGGFGGAAVERVRAMVEEFAPPIRRIPGDSGCGLAVVISAGLFEGLQRGGTPRLGWRYAAGSNAWLRVYDPFALFAPRVSRAAVGAARPASNPG